MKQLAALLMLAVTLQVVSPSTAVADTQSIEVLEAFIQRFSQTFYADLARARVRELKESPKRSPVIASLPSQNEAARPSTYFRQRAILYDEDPADPKGRQYIGSVTWRTQNVGSAQTETAVRGDVSIPERKLSAAIVLKRNIDPTLPASHTIDVTFFLPSDFAGGGIKNLPGILLKSNEQARGEPLSGLAVKVRDGYFLVGLSNVAKDRARNLQLLNERQWFDIPLVYENQRRGILAIEKGASGNQAFDAALSGWNQSTNSSSRANAPSPPKTNRGPSPPVFPSLVSPTYSTEEPGKARMLTCRDQLANKATDSNGGLLWVQQGGGYYPECNKRLKG
ncbi:hypothetical protein [Bradyrhizobium sp. ISRA442]|uniref:hypothetical protein n=1 Tax=Bradyrhizobium sp. ISRA442 TaxID=2866197 RepID=UPI00311AFA32